MVMKDKVYEELDDISRFVEPWDMLTWKLMDKIPNEIDLSFDILKELFDSGTNAYNDVLVTKIFSTLFEGDEKWATDIISNLSLVERSDNTPDFWIDFSTNEMNGRVFLVLRKPEYKDIPLAITKAVCRTFYPKVYDLKRTKEVLEIFGVNTTKRNVSTLATYLYNAITKNIADDVWRIRSDKVIYDMVRWAYMYIESGNYSAYASLLNLKCMVHRGNPIYSAEEVG